eukprot:GFKZ01015572.1.p1 GENE.GFKZ01015572.1~~GFKZ01015572.1.p1  ORF type:complete len:490 (+),score=72.77 GFKZ01015572.1:1-1470(+)
MPSRSVRIPLSASSSGSEPTSPEYSPLKPPPPTTTSSTTTLGQSRRRRSYSDSTATSLYTSKRKISVDDVIRAANRIMPILSASFFALVFLVFIHARFVDDSSPIDLSPISLTPSASKRMTNRQVVDELKRWRDPAYASSRLKVYYYDLPPKFHQGLVEESHRNPPKIRDPFCDESFYSAEYTIARLFKTSAVRTLNASEADYFYAPILTTCYLMTNLPNDVDKTGAFFNDAMDIVINEYPYWNRSDGRDHVFMFAQGFGARLSGNWSRYRQATFLVHNGDYEEEHYNPHKDVVVPPDLSHYLTPVDVEYPGRLLRKKNFVLFGGQVLNTSISDHRGSNYSGGVRQFVAANLSDADGYKITGVRSDTYVKDMMESVFCLAPHGWHKWSPRPAYAILLGCIPVVISEQQELFLEGLVDYKQISYWVKPEEVRELDDKLRGIGHEELTEKEKALRDVWRLFWYGDGGLAKEAILYSLYRKLASSRPVRAYV